MNRLISAATSHAVAAPAAPQRSSAPTVFRAHYLAAQFHVLVRARPGKMFTLAQMECVAQDQWQLALALPPGTYRYRYLAELEGPAAYVSPAEAESPPPPMRRLDAILTVRAIGAREEAPHERRARS